MTTSLRRIVASPWFVLATTCLVIALTLAAGRAAGLTRADWPGWVQAVGSVAAIFVAIWVSWQQIERQQQREQAKDNAEMRGILKSIQAELDETLAFAREHIGKSILHTERGIPIRQVFPLAENPFPIYSAFTPQLGKIDPDSLREQLVETFTYARSFVLTARYHNQMVETLGYAEAQLRTTPSRELENEIKIRSDNLAAYSDSLRDAFYGAIAKGDGLAQRLSSI